MSKEENYEIRLKANVNENEEDKTQSRIGRLEKYVIELKEMLNELIKNKKIDQEKYDLKKIEECERNLLNLKNGKSVGQKRSDLNVVTEDKFQKLEDDIESLTSIIIDYCMVDDKENFRKNVRKSNKKHDDSLSEEDLCEQNPKKHKGGGQSKKRFKAALRNLELEVTEGNDIGQNNYLYNQMAFNDQGGWGNNVRGSWRARYPYYNPRGRGSFPRGRGYYGGFVNNRGFY